MLDKPIVNTFSHVKPGDTPWVGEGLRSFFEYRDLGIAEATGGRVIAQLVRAKEAPEKGTGWHRHIADFHIVIMLKGWARFMYEDKEHLVSAGDCVHQRPGIMHFLFDYSPDMEYLEVVGPADFGTVEMTSDIPGSRSASLVGAEVLRRPSRYGPACPGRRFSMCREGAVPPIRTRYPVRRSAQAPSVPRRTIPSFPARP